MSGVRFYLCPCRYVSSLVNCGRNLIFFVQGRDFPIHGDNFRFASWNEHHKDNQGRKVDANGEILIHPEPVVMSSVEKIQVSLTSVLLSTSSSFAIFTWWP